MIEYPAELPLGLMQGRSYQTVNMIMRTPLESGRSRYRRKFTSVPVQTNISWLFSYPEGRLFENFFKEALKDGILEFSCNIRTALGVQPFIMRFMSVYQGPTLVGPNLVGYSADVEIRDRPVMPGDWSILPTFMVRPDIFDKAVNREWPEA